MTRRLLTLAIACLSGCEPTPALQVDSPIKTAAPATAATDSGTAGDADLDDVVIDVERPSEIAPVTAAAAISPTVDRPGDAASLFVRVRIAPGWHIYGLGEASSPNQPTHIKLTLPSGIAADGHWKAPAPDSQVTPMGLVSVYETEVTFSQQLKISTAKPLDGDSLTCELHYQACDRTRCLRPDILTLTVSTNVVPHEE